MPSVEPAPVKSSLSTPETITLFRSLFRDREDVYAQRWESQDRCTGYSPRTDRDWQAYYAAKPAPIGCHDGGICAIDGVPTSEIERGFVVRG